MIKRPDVWGDGKLTRSRVEFETQMASQPGSFRQVISGEVAVSDRVMVESQTLVGVEPGIPWGKSTPASSSPQVAPATSNGDNTASSQVSSAGEMLGKRRQAHGEDGVLHRSSRPSGEVR